MRRLLLPLTLTLFVAGCAGTATRQMADGLARAIGNHDDPQTVHDGATAFLLLADSLIESSPESPELLLSGARLYSAYAGAFVDEPERRIRLSDRALGYANRALCLGLPELCEAKEFVAFEAALTELDADDVPLLYAYGAALAGWIEARSDQWAAIAQLPRVEAAMRRVIALNESHEHGRAHLYLGVLRSRLPPCLGGRPEEGRAHFERALELSGGRDLIVLVEYARNYARLTFDRPLHDRLLQRVVTAPVQAPGLTLSNTIAQRQARALLASADDYFVE